MSQADSVVASLVTALVTALAREIGEPFLEKVLAPLIIQFGEDIVRGKIDYISYAIQMADRRAKEEFGGPRESSPPVDPVAAELASQMADIRAADKFRK